MKANKKLKAMEKWKSRLKILNRVVGSAITKMLRET